METVTLVGRPHDRTKEKQFVVLDGFEETAGDE
jgi:hypothetical protein